MQLLEKALHAIEQTAVGRELSACLRMLFEVSDRHAIPHRPVLDLLFDAVRILECRKQEPRPSIPHIAEEHFHLTEKALWNLIAKLTEGARDASAGGSAVAALESRFRELMLPDGVPLEVRIFRLFPEPVDGVEWPPSVDSGLWVSEASVIARTQDQLGNGPQADACAANPRIRAALNALVSHGYLAAEYRLKQRQYCYIALKRACHCAVPRTPFERKERNRRLADVVPHVEQEHCSQVTLSLTRAGLRYMRELVLSGETRERLGLVVPFADKLKTPEGATPVAKPTYAFVFGLWAGPAPDTNWHGGFNRALVEWDNPDVCTGAYAMHLDEGMIQTFRTDGDADARKCLAGLLRHAESLGTGPRVPFTFSFGHGPIGGRVTPAASATPPVVVPKKPKRTSRARVAALLLALGIPAALMAAPTPGQVLKAASSQPAPLISAKGESWQLHDPPIGLPFSSPALLAHAKGESWSDMDPPYLTPSTLVAPRRDTVA